MTAKCIKCNLHWNISIKKEMPPEGYICPRHIAKMKQYKGQATKSKQQKER